MFLGVLVSALLTWDKENSILFYSLFVWTVSIIALRDPHIGSDSFNYYLYFLNPSSYGYSVDDREFEKVYVLWNNFIRMLWPNGHVYLFCTAIFETFPIVLLIKKYSPYKIASVAIFVGCITWWSCFSTLRQCNAISCFLISVLFYLNKKYAIAFIFFVVAYFSHATIIALVPILIFAVTVGIPPKKYIYAILAISLVCGLCGVLDFQPLFKVVFSHFQNSAMIERYSGYGEEGGDSAFSSFYLNIKKLLPGTLLCGICWKYAKIDIQSHVLFKLYTLSVILRNLLFGFLLADRIVQFIGIFDLVAIPMALGKQKNTGYIYFVLIIYYIYQLRNAMSLMPNFSPYHLFAPIF